jgi:hypothetical protein
VGRVDHLLEPLGVAFDAGTPLRRELALVKSDHTNANSAGAADLPDVVAGAIGYVSEAA